MHLRALHTLQSTSPSTNLGSDFYLLKFQLFLSIQSLFQKNTEEDENGKLLNFITTKFY